MSEIPTGGSAFIGSACKIIFEHMHYRDAQVKRLQSSLKLLHAMPVTLERYEKWLTCHKCKTVELLDCSGDKWPYCWDCELPQPENLLCPECYLKENNGEFKLCPAGCGDFFHCVQDHWDICYICKNIAMHAGCYNSPYLYWDYKKEECISTHLKCLTTDWLDDHKGYSLECNNCPKEEAFSHVTGLTDNYKISKSGKLHLQKKQKKQKKETND